MSSETETPAAVLPAHGPAGQQAKTVLQAALTDRRVSALRKYQDLVVGVPGLGALIKHEVITSVFGPLPGALGLLLRQQAFRALLSRVGRGVVFGRSVTLRHPRKIQLGDHVIIDEYAVLDAKGTDRQGIRIGDHVMVGRNTVLSCKNGNITIGRNANIAMNCLIQSANEVRIGDNVLIAPYCYVIGGGDHRTERTDLPIIAQGQVAKGITIEDNCWIGAGVKVLDGVRIGRDSIIGAGAVVTRSIPPYAVAAGVPATVRRLRRPMDASPEHAGDGRDADLR